jgi:hypothetical protein
MIETKAFGTFIRIYSLFRCELLSANIQLNPLQGTDQISSDLRFSRLGISGRDTYLLKVLRMQNKVLLTIGNFPSHTSVRDMHTAVNLPYV